MQEEEKPHLEVPQESLENGNAEMPEHRSERLSSGRSMQTYEFSRAELDEIIKRVQEVSETTIAEIESSINRAVLGSKVINEIKDLRRAMKEPDSLPDIISNNAGRVLDSVRNLEQILVDDYDRGGVSSLVRLTSPQPRDTSGSYSTYASFLQNSLSDQLTPRVFPSSRRAHPSVCWRGTLSTSPRDLILIFCAFVLPILTLFTALIIQAWR